MRETIDDISPIEDYTGNLAIVFGDFKFDEPTHSVAECREKDITYSRPLNVKVAFQNRETGEIRERTVFMGDFPWMTERGTFIINGTERSSSPSSSHPRPLRDGARRIARTVFIANLDAEPGFRGSSWRSTRRGGCTPGSIATEASGHGAAAAMGFVSDEEILQLFEPAPCTSATRSKAVSTNRRKPRRARWSSCSRSSGQASRRRSTRPGRWWTALLRPQALRLTRVGRYKLNARLDLDVDLDMRVLTKRTTSSR